MSDPTPRSGLRRYLWRTVIIASAIAAALILVIILLDFFGSQPQPFQYLLH